MTTRLRTGQIWRSEVGSSILIATILHKYHDAYFAVRLQHKGREWKTEWFENVHMNGYELDETSMIQQTLERYEV